MAKLQFAKIVKIASEDYIGDFQEAIRQEYPRIQRENAQSVELQVEGQTVQARTTDQVVWRFFDAETIRRVTLTAEAITLETAQYTSRGEFLEQFNILLNAIKQTIRPSLAMRIGFRFVNRLDDQNDLLHLDKLIYPELTGLMTSSLQQRVEQSLSQAQCQSEEGLLLVRWGKLAAGTSHDPNMVPPVDSASWILDIDSIRTEGSFTKQFDPPELSRLVEEMSNRAYSFFRWSVTEAFLERFGVSEQ